MTASSSNNSAVINKITYIRINNLSGEKVLD